MKYILLGLLLGLLAAFPPVAVLLGHLVLAAAVWTAVQPIAWALAAGAVVGRSLPRRPIRSTS